MLQRENGDRMNIYDKAKIPGSFGTRMRIQRQGSGRELLGTHPKAKVFFGDFLFIIMNPFINITDGENDGLCPVESAKWGNFRGVITTKGIFGISHAGVIDAYRLKYKGVNLPQLYMSIIEELGAKGF